MLQRMAAVWCTVVDAATNLPVHMLISAECTALFRVAMEIDSMDMEMQVVDHVRMLVMDKNMVHLWLAMVVVPKH